MLQLEATPADVLKGPDCVQRAEGFRAAQLEGRIPGHRIREAQHREAGHVVVRNPADLVATPTVDRGSGVAEIKAGNRSQPYLHQEGRPQHCVGQSTFFNVSLDCSFRISEWKVAIDMTGE